MPTPFPPLGGKGVGRGIWVQKQGDLPHFAAPLPHLSILGRARHRNFVFHASCPALRQCRFACFLPMYSE